LGRNEDEEGIIAGVNCDKIEGTTGRVQENCLTTLTRFQALDSVTGLIVEKTQSVLAF
jgi:hypothetical protein